MHLIMVSIYGGGGGKKIFPLTVCMGRTHLGFYTAHVIVETFMLACIYLQEIQAVCRQHLHLESPKYRHRQCHKSLY